MAIFQGNFKIERPGDGARLIASGITTFRDAVNRARGIVTTRRGSVTILELWKDERAHGYAPVVTVHMSGGLQVESNRGNVLLSEFRLTCGELSASEKDIVEEMMTADEELTLSEATRRVREGSLRLGDAVNRNRVLNEILAELDTIHQKISDARIKIRDELDG